MNGKRILLIIGGGIAAYKCLDLIRRLRERGVFVRIVMTGAAAEFVTPLSLGALAGERVYQELFDGDDEQTIGHIRLARDADLIVVAPATADLMAKMALGLANDLATSVLLATTAPILVAPAMNPKMWLHKATQRNVAQLKSDGVRFVGPGVGEMAESNEAGPGRLAEVPELMRAIAGLLAAPGLAAAEAGAALQQARPLKGLHVLITAGPTHEPIDPVRYLANRSSGKQGYAIAEAAVQASARVTLIAGPTGLPDPAGVTVLHVETAQQMLAGVGKALPAEIAIFAAAVADWRVAEPSGEKIKKGQTGKLASAGKPTGKPGGKSGMAQLQLVENPDILKTIAKAKSGRPALVIGFAAETENLIANASAKLNAKGCDWIVANDVSSRKNSSKTAADDDGSGGGGDGRSSVLAGDGGHDVTGGAALAGGVMGGDHNKVHIVSAAGVESWPLLSKSQVAKRLIAKAARQLRQRSAPKQKVTSS